MIKEMFILLYFQYGSFGENIYGIEKASIPIF